MRPANDGLLVAPTAAFQGSFRETSEITGFDGTISVPGWSTVGGDATFGGKSGSVLSFVQPAGAEYVRQQLVETLERASLVGMTGGERGKKLV